MENLLLEAVPYLEELRVIREAQSSPDRHALASLIERIEVKVVSVAEPVAEPEEE